MTFPRLALAVLLLTAALPAAAQEVSYQLSNASRLTVVEFYSSPMDQGTWGDDLLRAGVLEPGGTVNVTIHGGQCDYDFRTGGPGPVHLFEGIRKRSCQR